VQGIGVDGRARRVHEEEAVHVEVRAKAHWRRGAQPAGEIHPIDAMSLQFGQTKSVAPMSQSRRHAKVLQTMSRQSEQARVAAVGGRHARYRGIGGSNHLHGRAIHMAYGVCPRPHIGGRGDASSSRGSTGPRDAILPGAAGAWGRPTCALPAVTGTRGRGGGLMQLLLVAEKQVTTGEATGAFGALERLLFCMRPLVALEMLQTSERPLAGAADMGTRLVGLGRGEGGRSLGVDHDGRGFLRERRIVSSDVASAQSRGREYWKTKL
jgi:hypothetical protein